MKQVHNVFAGQNVGVKQVDERIWFVTMQYDLGFFDDETCRLEPAENPFRAPQGQSPEPCPELRSRLR